MVLPEGEKGGAVSVVSDGVPAGKPRWCYALSAVPVVVGGLALLGSDGQDPFAAWWWAVPAYWLTGVSARWVLRRQGHDEVAVPRWVSKEQERTWVVLPMAALLAWAFVDSFRTALTPGGDWWSWVEVAFGVGVTAGGLLLAGAALNDWRRRRAAG